jgi:hypothetical protein
MKTSPRPNGISGNEGAMIGALIGTNHPELAISIIIYIRVSSPVLGGIFGTILLYIDYRDSRLHEMAHRPSPVKNGGHCITFNGTISRPLPGIFFFT